MIDTIVTAQLLELREEFRKHGFDIRMVGGCVRDLLAGHAPKDIDLCTDADPQQQVNIYTQAGVKFVATGIEHGTITVVMDDQVYEVTSLRMDVSTDGRRATVAYVNNCAHGVFDLALLQQFQALGYNMDQDYPINELVAVFRDLQAPKA